MHICRKKVLDTFLSELTPNETNENIFFDDNYQVVQMFEVPHYSNLYILFLQILTAITWNAYKEK